MTHHSSPVTEPALLPCPFCGSSDVSQEYGRGNWPVVQCDDCGATGPITEIIREKSNALWNARAAHAQTPTSSVQHGADYLFDELDKLGGHVTYTACKALVTKLYALGIPAQEARVPKVRTSHHRNKEEAARLQELVDKRYAPAQSTLNDAAEALIEQYDLGAGSCLGVMSDGKPCFKGSFLEKLEALRSALSSTECCEHGVKVGNTCVDCLGAAVTRPDGGGAS